MNFLFWLLWVINIVLLLLVIAGGGFRSGFGANIDLNVLLTIFLIIDLIVSIWLKFSIKTKWISILVVALPVLVLFLMYLFEKKKGNTI